MLVDHFLLSYYNVAFSKETDWNRLQYVAIDSNVWQSDESSVPIDWNLWKYIGICSHSLENGICEQKFKLICSHCSKGFQINSVPSLLKPCFFTNLHVSLLI